MDHYAQLPDGRLFICDGLGPAKVWDGLKAAPVDAGIAAPTAALTLSAPTPVAGSIIGTYTAYLRWLDDLDQPSDLAPVSNTLTAKLATSTLSIAALTKSSPIRLTTTVAHGLTTGDRISIEQSEVPEWNGVYTVTRLTATTVSLDDTDGRDYDTSDLTGVVHRGITTISYAIDFSSRPAKAVRWQILRNLDGEAGTYYVDVEDDDFVTTPRTSTRVDSNLATQTAVPLFDSSDGTPLANSHGVPTDTKAVAAHHLGRLFQAVDKPYKEGALVTQNGSDQVRGLNTSWRSNWAGRFVWIDGADQAYEIESIDEAAQTMTLTDAYGAATSPYALYQIRPAAASRRLLYYSEADQPESIPVFNALSLQEDGDEHTGLMVHSSFIYVLEERHIYRFTFQSKPSTDGYIYLVEQRGCINQDCWVLVEGAAYMLDRAGVHKFSGGKSEPIATTVQGLFTGLDSRYRVNWNAAENFHASYFPDEEVIRWFVSLGGLERPRHALCFHVRLNRWWLTSYPFEISASTAGLLGGFPQVYAGSTGAKVWAMSTGTLDGIRPGKGDLRGMVDSADVTSITDNSASYDVDVVGLPVYLVAGKGKLQGRTIHSVAGGRLKVDRPWTIKPDRTSEYQIGGVPYLWESGQFHLALPQDKDSARTYGVRFQPSQLEDNLYTRIFLDYEPTPMKLTNTHAAINYEGAGSKVGESEISMPMNSAEGYAQQQLAYHKTRNMRGTRAFSLELQGVAGPGGNLINEITLEGVEAGGD